MEEEQAEEEKEKEEEEEGRDGTKEKVFTREEKRRKDVKSKRGKGRNSKRRG